MIDWLSHDVLPSIRKHGYYVPPDGGMDDELRAMIDQRSWNDELMEFMNALFPAPVIGSFESEIPREPGIR